ncbi:MAG TPA: CoA-transferase [bacterium]|nr:CoA-transferase [bacterium]
MEYSKQEKIDYLLYLLSQYVRDADRVSTGVASFVPMTAILLAQAMHAPRACYLNCLGAVNPRYEQLGNTSEEAGAVMGQDSFLSLPALFDMGARGDIDVMFFSAPQMDAQGRINLTGIGTYEHPKVKFPGPAGSGLMLARVKRPVLYHFKHSRQVLVKKVDFSTAQAVHLPTVPLVTDLAVFHLQAGGKPLLVQVHPWSSPDEVAAMTGFTFKTGKPEIEVSPARLRKASEVLNRLDARGRRYAVALGDRHAEAS